MFQTLRRMILTMVACGAATWLTAGPGPIGMAAANGSFQLDHARVWGSGTLFDGSSIETSKISSQLKLNGGAVMRLAADSRATVYESKMVLEHGLMESGAGLEVEARSLHIMPATNNGIMRINVDASRGVEVAAIRGIVRVTTAGGLLVAKVAEGSSLSFDPETARAGVAKKLGAGVAAAGTAAAAGSAAAAGIGVGTVAAIGGVATAATVGGLAAAGSLPGQGETEAAAAASR